MIAIGIDPGRTGAVAFVDQRGSCAIEDMPIAACGKRLDGKAFVAMIRRHASAYDSKPVVWIERPPQVMKTVRGTSAARSLFGMADALGACFDILSIEPRYAMPQQWKRLYGGLTGKTDAEKKEAGRLCALRLYPAAEVFLSRKKDHNRAEALLIAHYGLSKHA